ncbi:MAG: radical SAM protein [Candidatus Nezhaarchaeota archaeon]|nr:radical SAM protein [Candidatus Nezhaarchaeota archaeon]MCX8141239.1 radical SAM protein [Candidatus Nezhaarchaeota archaeon]MDW8049505.1 radical SAM protein [Nitrososphaerota archaeon]
MSRESPDYVRISTAADIVLGFSAGRFFKNAYPYCINLLLHFNDGCKANCLYCGQAREVGSSPECRSLIRVEWQLRNLEEIIKSINRFNLNGCSMRPYRVCVASITNSKAVDAEIEVVKRVHNATKLPISALITPTIFNKDDVKKLRDAGAERIGIAIDCANDELFDLLRGNRARGPHRWGRYLEGVIEAVEVMGKGRVGIHLIVGLGEEEEEAIRLIQWAHDVGAETHLFSFYPELGSILEGWTRPPIGQYRRVQLARYLINSGISRYEWMNFNERGQVVNFGVLRSTLEEVIESGLPFVTSGCPGCNRPYANERPSERPRNYPYVPTSGAEIEAIKRELSDYKPFRNDIHALIGYLKFGSMLTPQIKAY